MKKIKLVIILSFITSVLVFAHIKITPAKAKNYIGKTETITGIIDQVHLTNTGTYFLNMGGKFPNNPFTAIIFKSDASKFGDIKRYAGKEVEVSGMVKEYKNETEIILESKKQIKFVKESNTKK